MQGIGKIGEIMQILNATEPVPFPSPTIAPAPPKVLKILLLLGLLIITFLCSLLPFGLRRAATQTQPEGRRRRFAAAFGFLSCFGGGVFLATCLLDLFPDSVELVGQAMIHFHLKTKNGDFFPLAEFLVAIGFFVVLFLEQVVLFYKECGPENPENVQSRRILSPTTDISVSQENLIQEANGTTEYSQVDNADRNHDEQQHSADSAHEHDNHSHGPKQRRLTGVLQGISTDSDRFGNNYVAHDESDGDVHFDPDAHSTLRSVILVGALSLHALFEGLALGLVAETDILLQIFAALCIHKSVLAFSLGLRLVQSRLPLAGIVACCLLFAVMAPLGGLIGLAVLVYVERSYTHMVSGSLQAIACGTFLYVTLFEILPHELNQKGNRMWKMFFLILGFALISVFILLFPG